MLISLIIIYSLDQGEWIRHDYTQYDNCETDDPFLLRNNHRMTCKENNSHPNHKKCTNNGENTHPTSLGNETTKGWSKNRK